MAGSRSRPQGCANGAGGEGDHCLGTLVSVMTGVGGGVELHPCPVASEGSVLGLRCVWAVGHPWAELCATSSRGILAIVPTVNLPLGVSSALSGRCSLRSWARACGAAWVRSCPSPLEGQVARGPY